MRVLAFSSLHPSLGAPTTAAWMPGRLSALAAHAAVSAVVPRQRGCWPLPAAARAAVEPRAYQLQEPTFWALRGLHRERRPAQMLAGAWPTVAALHAAQPCQVVLGHYLWPDGVAAAALAARLGRPLVLVAHGSDVNEQCAVPARRAQVGGALQQAAALICVSRALQQRLLEWGLPATDATILPCGYDPQVFRPQPRAAARRALALSGGPWLLYVGAFRRLKRIDLLLEALGRLPEARLALVGDGPERTRLADQARRLGVAHRLLWAGALPSARVATWYAAADLVVLASEREGTPTVLTEALACGTPVVATRVGGIPELVGDAALLVEPGAARALADALAATLAEPPPADRLTARVRRLAWPEIGAAEAQILESVVH
ncbi:MAG: glycosyltransferase [Fimbriimonadaceae bacterium]|nr:glycosyltransferase [Fimbriimonadaceae bacterium]